MAIETTTDGTAQSQAVAYKNRVSKILRRVLNWLTICLFASSVPLMLAVFLHFFFGIAIVMSNYAPEIITLSITLCLTSLKDIVDNRDRVKTFIGIYYVLTITTAIMLIVAYALIFMIDNSSVAGIVQFSEPEQILLNIGDISISTFAFVAFLGSIIQTHIGIVIADS